LFRRTVIFFSIHYWSSAANRGSLLVQVIYDDISGTSVTLCIYVCKGL